MPGVILDLQGALLPMLAVGRDRDGERGSAPDALRAVVEDNHQVPIRERVRLDPGVVVRQRRFRRGRPVLTLRGRQRRVDALRSAVAEEGAERRAVPGPDH